MTRLAATALAQAVLGALNLARDQPGFDQAITGVLGLLRDSWPPAGSRLRPAVCGPAGRRIDGTAVGGLCLWIQA